MGRWLSRDPITELGSRALKNSQIPRALDEDSYGLAENQSGVESGSANSYQFVLNNSINSIDPDGEFVVVASFVAAKVVAIGVAYIGAKIAAAYVNEEASDAVDTAMVTVVEINASEAASMAAGEVVAVAVGAGWRYFRICGKFKRGLKICFAPGTQVLMADGTTKAIEDIKKGDFVIGDNPEDEEPVNAYEVKEIHQTATYRFFKINIDGGYVKATSRHPFWTQRGWVAAEDLNESDSLYDDLGVPVKIDSIDVEFVDSLTYNLSVDQVSTYFVVAGDTPILVHNLDPWEIQFSRMVDPNETFQHGVWKGKKIADAIVEARKLGKLPEGLRLNAARYISASGDEVIVAINNRTLYVAQEAGLVHVHPVNDMNSSKALSALQKQLKLSVKKGGTGTAFWRCQ